MSQSPFELFDQCYAEAREKESAIPDAMSLASVDAEGRPSLRMVLLKEHGKDGFVFFTNFESRKGRELLANPHAALLFHWKSLRRQIRIEGKVAPVTDAEADAYFASRPRDAQIGAWASDQSRRLSSRTVFIARIAEQGLRFTGRDVPRPAHWSGFRLVPAYFEYWHDGRFRLHDRTAFILKDGAWQMMKLYP